MSCNGAPIVKCENQKAVKHVVCHEKHPDLLFKPEQAEYMVCPEWN
jgi:hypothetical protein